MADFMWGNVEKTIAAMDMLQAKAVPKPPPLIPELLETPMEVSRHGSGMRKAQWKCNETKIF